MEGFANRVCVVYLLYVIRVAFCFCLSYNYCVTRRTMSVVRPNFEHSIRYSRSALTSLLT